MTCHKFNIILLSFLLMAMSLGLTQEQVEEEEEEGEEEVTDSMMETLMKSTVQPEENDIYFTCDFDLENIENLLQYLPDICTEIYSNRINDSTLYDLYLEESQNFAIFYKKLNDYELRDQPNGDIEELTEYPFETQLRNEMYNKVDWAQCTTTANSSVSDYLNCLKVKRLELADLVPDLEGK